jgi:hypothetical protein
MLQEFSRTERVDRSNVLVEVNAAVRELAELSSLLDLCRANILSAIRILVRRVCVVHVRVHPPASKPSDPPISYFILGS